MHRQKKKEISHFIL